jgi:hypothetical protein
MGHAIILNNYKIIRTNPGLAPLKFIFLPLSSLLTKLLSRPGRPPHKFMNDLMPL